MSRQRLNRRSGPPLLPAEDSRRVGSVGTAHGLAQQRAPRSGRCPGRREVLLQSSGTRTGRSSPGAIRNRTAQRRLSLHGRLRHRAHLPGLSLVRSGHHAAPRAKGVGAVGRHAPGLLPELRFSGLPAHGSLAARQRPEAAPDGSGDCPSLPGIPIALGGMECLVGDHAPGAAGRELATVGVGNRTGTVFRNGEHHQGGRNQRRVHDPCHLPFCTWRRTNRA